MAVSSTLPDYSSAPSLEGRQVYSPRARKEAGVSASYVDQYNDSQLAQYNNEYNYWLWQQQAEYNSPANQMARAREAGLNPNVVAGNVSSGNLSSTPESKANFKSHIFENKMQAVNTGINAFNSVINAVADGVKSVSALSGIPDDISNYRKLLNSSQMSGLNLQMANNIAKNLENMRSGYLMFGNSMEPVFSMLGFPNVADIANSEGKFIAPIITKALEDSYYGQGLINSLNRQGLTNQKIYWDNKAAKYRYDNILPAELQNILGRTDSQYWSTELMRKQYDWYTANRIAPWILGGAGLVGKIL